MLHEVGTGQTSDALPPRPQPTRPSQSISSGTGRPARHLFPDHTHLRGAGESLEWEQDLDAGSPTNGTVAHSHENCNRTFYWAET